MSKSDWMEGRGYRKRLLVREDRLLCPGTLVQIVEIDPNTTVPLHYHKTSVEVFHVLEGHGVMTIGGAEHRLAPGDTVVCQPPAVHNARNETAVPWRYIVFKTNAVEGDIYWLSDE